LLSDGNAIYISGTGKGNVIRYNYVHDNLAHSLPAAIRCDDDQHETLIYGNVLYNNGGFAAGIASKGRNDIINNFIVAPAVAPRLGYISFEWAPVTGSKAQRNIIVSHPKGGNLYAERLRRGKQTGGKGPKLIETDMDKNLYYHPKDPHWADKHLRRMRAAGKEKASRFGNPLFVDPAGGDFSFRPGSPALALGIEPLNVSKMGRRDNRTLRVSDGSCFVPKDFYPEFSWKTTPRYFMFGDKSRVLRPEQVRFIADRTSFLCIEKSHGMGQLGAAELGAKHEAAAFKKAKPGMKVLFYFNAAYAWPYTSYNRDFTRQRIDKNPKLKQFLIANPKTGKLADRYGAFCYDVLNPDFRNWWVETVARGVRDSGCDGAFIDQMHGSVRLRPNKKAQIEKAMGQMMAALKKQMGPGRILLANNAYAPDARFVYPVSDAIMFENYAMVKSSKESLLAEWKHMLRNAKARKISVFRLGVEGTGRRNLKPNMPKLSREKLEFALACYLIGAEPYSYFMYSWGWKLSSGALVDYPELKKPLGPPKGAYKRTTPGGWEFTREFEHAAVWVNTETRKAKITWR